MTGRPIFFEHVLSDSMPFQTAIDSGFWTFYLWGLHAHAGAMTGRPIFSEHELSARMSFRTLSRDRRPSPFNWILLPWFLFHFLGGMLTFDFFLMGGSAPHTPRPPAVLYSPHTRHHSTSGVLDGSLSHSSVPLHSSFHHGTTPFVCIGINIVSGLI